MKLEYINLNSSFLKDGAYSSSINTDDTSLKTILFVNKNSTTNMYMSRKQIVNSFMFLFN